MQDGVRPGAQPLPEAVADATIGGWRVMIRLAVRRFFCPALGCKRTTFAEQVEGLTSQYARRTLSLAASLGAVGAALAGRAVSRLAARAGDDGRADLHAAAADGPARHSGRDGAVLGGRLRVPPRPRPRHDPDRRRDRPTGPVDAERLTEPTAFRRASARVAQVFGIHRVAMR